MNNFSPYTYLITFIQTGQRYYGVRYGKNSNPEELGKSYFSSSKLVKSLIKEHGIELFKFEVRRIFNNRQKACDWESKVLQRLNVAHSKNWLNKRNNEGNFYARGKHSVETKMKISKANKGRKYKKRSIETIMKIAQSNTGQKRSEETKRKISEALRGKKRSTSSIDTINKRAKSNKGKKRSEETKRKISEAAKNRKISTRVGKKHSEETKRKISKALLGTKRPDVAERNKKFPRKIKLEELKV